MKKNDYYKSLQPIFNDKFKFQKVNNCSVLACINNIQVFLSKLALREKTSPVLHPKSAFVAHAQCLPKIHKEFDILLKFRPIIEITVTVDYNVGKFCLTFFAL